MRLRQGYRTSIFEIGLPPSCPYREPPPHHLPEIMNPPDPQFSARQYATIYTALGWLRGALYDVATGEFDKEQIQRLIESTSLARLSEISGIAEDDLTIDYHPHLTENEYHAIGGADWPEK